MRRIVQMARQVAVTDSPVLVTGETGTGKEVLARAVHGWSRRADGPWVAVNCAALPRELIESELFGHRKGAFSGADRDRPGRFRLADGGTLLLDEIGDLPSDLQVKLLRALEQGAVEPVGGDGPVPVDVRVVAATHVDLERAVARGRFREDLYYRLHVFPIHVPPLRERLDDLPVLVEQTLERARLRTGRGPWSLTKKDLSRLRRYDWPGNVRELVNVLERARVAAPLGGRLRVELPDSGVGVSGPRRLRTSGADRDPRGAGGSWPTLAEHQRRYIESVLQETGGKIYGEGGAAAILGIPPSTLQGRMRKLGVRRPKD
jgi:transcriptional regulator with GAF, ATPase, and Fis domain